MSLQKASCPGDYAPGVVLVGFHTATSVTSAKKSTLDIAGEIPVIDVVSLHVPVGRECAAVETLRRDPQVAFVELDYAVHAVDGMLRQSRIDPRSNDFSLSPRTTRVSGLGTTTTPNDPGWPSQWGPAKIEAPAAWDVITGTSDVVMAVLDTGVQLAHEDLSDRLWVNPHEIPDNEIDDDGNGKADDFWGWHFYHRWAWDGDGYTYLPEEDNQVDDENGHGTHVAGIAGAAINNGVGIAGMAGGARVMSVKVLDQYGEGWYSDLAQGIVYAVDNGADVINLSVGGRERSESLELAVDYAHAHSVLIVAAAGNKDSEDGYDAVLYPAAYEHALAVAATDQSDARAGFSNHGPELDVAAPGVDIYSTWYRGNYFTESGTSMATPHLAGLAALMWSARPDLTLASAVKTIAKTAVDANLGTHPGWDEDLGWGRIDAGRALSAAVRTGDLELTASRYLCPVGGTVLITAALPAVGEATVPVTLTAEGGTVIPETTMMVNGVATTTLTAGPLAGSAVVSAVTDAPTGTLFLRLLPGPMISSTLTAASPTPLPGNWLPLTVWASDRFGNVPLNGTPIDWSADAGTLSPSRSTFRDGEGRAAFTPSVIKSTATITASWPGGAVVTTTVELTADVHLLYLPILYHQTE
ncbi:MAG: S8 family peptidase [Anaerolineae bacterium]